MRCAVVPQSFAPTIAPRSVGQRSEEVDRLAGCDRWRFQRGAGQVCVPRDDVVGPDGSGEEGYVVVLGVAKHADSGLGVRLDPEESGQFLDEFVDFGQPQEFRKRSRRRTIWQVARVTDGGRPHPVDRAVYGIRVSARPCHAVSVSVDSRESCPKLADSNYKIVD